MACAPHLPKREILIKSPSTLTIGVPSNTEARRRESNPVTCLSSWADPIWYRRSSLRTLPIVSAGLRTSAKSFCAWRTRPTNGLSIASARLPSRSLKRPSRSKMKSTALRTRNEPKTSNGRSAHLRSGKASRIVTAFQLRTVALRDSILAQRSSSTGRVASTRTPNWVSWRAAQAGQRKKRTS